MNSPIVVGEDGSGGGLPAVGFEFGVDPNEDPELALALRVSMEEQRARQEDEAKKVTVESSTEAGTQPAETAGGMECMMCVVFNRYCFDPLTYFCFAWEA